MKLKLFIYLFCITTIFSCRKPEDVPAPSSIIQGRKWRVISYNQNGNELINLFSNCVLAFNNFGVLVISNGGQDYTGTWQEFSAPPKIEIDVISADTYVNLFNKTWESILLNPGRIQLADDKINPQEIIKLDLIP